MHDPNGIYHPLVQLSAVRLRLRWFRELDHYQVTDEEARLIVRERELVKDPMIVSRGMRKQN